MLFVLSDMWAVHLRLRGEHVTAGLSSTDWNGSPPPARRALAGARMSNPPPRFTSACAESTGGSCGTSSTTAVHLRLRGEHPTSGAALSSSFGSPPPARRAPCLMIPGFT